MHQHIQVPNRVDVLVGAFEVENGSRTAEGSDAGDLDRAGVAEEVFTRFEFKPDRFPNAKSIGIDPYSRAKPLDLDRRPIVSVVKEFQQRPSIGIRFAPTIPKRLRVRLLGFDPRQRWGTDWRFERGWDGKLPGNFDMPNGQRHFFEPNALASGWRDSKPPNRRKARG